MDAQRPVLNIPARELRLNRRAITFLICLCISALLWVVISLSENYTERRYFPVHYRDLPTDVNPDALEDTLSLEFSTTGFNLLFYDPGNEAIEVDASRLLQSQSGGFYFIPNSMLARQFNRQFGSTLKVLRLHPDTLKLPRLLGEGRMLPVSLSGKIPLHGDLDVMGHYYLEPDSVLVKGEIRIKELLVDPSGIRLREGKNRLALSIGDPGPGMYPSQDSVYLVLTAEKYTEREFRVPVEIVGLPPGYSFKPVPKKVNVKCRVPYSRLHVEVPISAEVDYKDIEAGKATKVKVHVKCQDPRIKIIRTHPETVDFILRKSG